MVFKYVKSTLFGTNSLAPNDYILCILNTFSVGGFIYKQIYLCIHNYEFIMGVYVEVVDIVVAIVAIIIIKTFNIEDNQLQHYENVCE